MARAKRTDRAEARRRYRAATAPEPTDDAEEAAAPASPKPKSTSTSPASSSGTPQRMSMAAAFRASIRPVNVVDDIRALPWIATHSKALWLPLLITVFSTGLAIYTKGADAISAFLFAYFVQTPAIGGVFIAGFLAPRASWLLGVIVGFVAALGYSLYIVVAASQIVPAPAPGAAQDAIVGALILSPLLGAFFAAAAAWYRRFLALSNPNRARQAKGSAPKRGDGRTRTGSEKAGARR